MKTGFEYESSLVGQVVTKCCFLGFLFFQWLGVITVRAVHRHCAFDCFFFPKHSYTLHLCYKLGEIVSFSSRVESKYWLLGWVPKPSNSLKRAEPLKGPVETLALPPPLLWRPLNSWPLLASSDCFLLSVLLHLGLYQTLSIIPPTESSLTRSGCNTHVPVCLGFGVEREIRLQPKGAHTWDWIAETLN